MKLKLSLVSGLLALGLSPALIAMAEVQTFDRFVINIPPGWSTEFESGNNEGYGANLFISKEDQSAMVSYVMEPLASGQWEAMIKEMTDHPKPDTGPAQVNSANSFLVTFSDHRSGASGKETYFRINDTSYIKEVTIGYDPDLNGILNSFQVNENSLEEEQ